MSLEGETNRKMFGFNEVIAAATASASGKVRFSHTLSDSRRRPDSSYSVDEVCLD
jgi:hypothetical protein